ncbi:MAG: site-specific integrase [Pseudomonadota bacterium]
MPLEPRQRGEIWYAVGRVEYNGKPITKYLRISTGASEKAGAQDWIGEYQDREIRRHLLGSEAERLTIADAIVLYDKPSEAERLLKIADAKGDELLCKPVDEVTGKWLRNLGMELLPNCATDTMWREVVSPLRSVINNAHDLGMCHPIKVKRYSELERVQQDERRGKQSRVERIPGGRTWLNTFCAHADAYNAALARFLYETAARIDQAVSLTPDDLDLPNKRVWLKGQKGHPAQWVEISHGMMIELANLPPKRPKNRKSGDLMEPRIFGYGSKTGYTKRWRTICRNAGIRYISAHPTGRHGFYTELTVNQGVSSADAAKAGRWSNASVPDKFYSHAQLDEASIREMMRTDPAQDDTLNETKKLNKKG